MLVFTVSSATTLQILGTNPLGLLFLSIFGFLFTLQFLCMVWHRLGALIERLAGMDKIPKDPRRPYVRPQGSTDMLNNRYEFLDL